MDNTYLTYPDLAEAILNNGSENLEDLYDTASTFITRLNEFDEALQYFKDELELANINLKL